MIWPRTASAQLVLALVLLVSSIGGGIGPSSPASAAGTPLRQVDWNVVLANDPAVTIDPTAFQPGVRIGPYVQVTQPGSRTMTVEGYATLDDVLYADLDGDGAEEAVIPLSSGGTGGLIGYLLFREATPAPKLTIAQDGYKLGFEVDRNRLVISQPNYVGFEPNCCPSSTTRTVNKLEGDQLVVIASETFPNDVQEPTVWAFYQALSEKRYADAYDFLSPSFQASNPFDRWKAGYATTQSIEVETAQGVTPNEVAIVLTAVDARQGGGTVTRKFKGAWTLEWSADKKRWLLDKARIEPA